MIREKHGLTNHPLYKIWQGMKSRCYNKNQECYPRYGGKGIIVCEQWKQSFINFYNDMVSEYKHGLTIERKDSGGIYEPANCKWATYTEQNRNKSNNKSVAWIDENCKGKVYDYMVDVKLDGYDPKKVVEVCKGRNHTHKSKVWYYVEGNS